MIPQPTPADNDDQDQPAALPEREIIDASAMATRRPEVRAVMGRIRGI